MRPRLQNLEMTLEQTPLISIVDDDEAVREATKSLIRSLGYNAETFGSAEEFLAWTQIEDTDCLITDVQMPGLSGMDLQDRLALGRARDADNICDRLPGRQVGKAGSERRSDRLLAQAHRGKSSARAYRHRLKAASELIEGGVPPPHR